MSRRDEAKRKRRQKRAAHSARREVEPSLRRVLTNLKEAIAIPEPARWPGASTPELERPDHIKAHYGDWLSRREPGKSKMQQLENAMVQGPIGYVNSIEHWAMEEFFYHGIPGDSWHPIDAYLERHGERFTPAGQVQLRRWKDARVGLYRLGGIHDDTLELQEWDPIADGAVGPTLRAISLCIGGVNAFRGREGRFIASYVAPWAPEQNIVCEMGYSAILPHSDRIRLASHLGLRHPDIAARPWPWTANRSARHTYLQRWAQREWQGWLQERFVFPFHAFIPMPPHGERLALAPVTGLVPNTATDAQQFGIYFIVDLDKNKGMVCGATNIKLFDLTSPSLGPLSEYQTFREWAGPPPGTIGAPRFRTLR